MNAQAHVLLTAAGATLVAYGARLPMEVALPGIALAAAGSLLPDLDHAGSTAARALGPLTAAPAWVLQRAFGHRGALHSALAAALLGAVLWCLVGQWALPVAAGYAAHLVEDCWTPAGLPQLWWPLRVGRRRRSTSAAASVRSAAS